MGSNCLVNRLVVVVTALLMECGSGVIVAQTVPRFRPAEIPSAIVDVDARREYLALHYWDNFNIEDADLIDDDSLMSLAVGGYVRVLEMNPPAIVEKSLEVILSKALKCGYTHFESFTSSLEDWLYNPNSPMRNDELYSYVLRYTVERAEVEDIYKIRSRNQLEMLLKNRIGDVATDFKYEDVTGSISTLHSITAPFTILFFNTPDCGDCRRVKEYIGRSNSLLRLASSGRLTILGLYTEGDRELWLKTKYPSVIVNGSDSECKIVKSRLYDLKALPTLYLLDVDKKVVLKDRTIEDIEAYLNRL